MSAAVAKPRRWRRRLLWLLAIVLLLRIALSLSLPWLVERAAAAAGWSVQCRAASLSLLGLDVQLVDLVVRGAAAADQPALPDLLHCDSIQASVSTWDLLHGDLVVDEVRLTRARVALARRPDGTLIVPLPPANPAAAPAQADTPAPPDFSLPLRLGKLRALDLHLELHELGAAADAPPLEAWVVDLIADELGDPLRAGSLTLRVHGEDRLDHLELTASLQNTPTRLAAAFALDGRGLRLQNHLFAPLRAPFADPARLADAELRGTVTVAIEANGALRVETRTDARLALDGADVLEFTASAGPAEWRDGTLETPFAVRCAAPALWQELALADGTLRSAGGALALRTTLRAIGVTAGPLRGWLAEQGVLLPASGDATANIDFARAADGRLDASVRDVAFGSADDQVRLATLEVAGLRHDAGGLAIERLGVQGLRAGARRDASGTLHVAGVQLMANTTRRAPAAAPGAPDPAPTPTTSPTSQAPGLALAQLDGRDLDLRWRDESLPQPADLRLQGLQLRSDGVQIGPAASRGALQLEFAVADAVEQVAVTATLRTPAAGALQADLQIGMRGAHLTALRPYFEPAGLTCAWQAATLALRTSVQLQPEAGGGHQLQLTVDELGLRDGAGELLTLGALQATAHLPVGGPADPGAVTLTRLELPVARRASGELAVAGFVFPGAPQPPADWRLVADAELAAPGGDGQRPFALTLGVADLVEQLRIAGTLRAGSPSTGALPTDPASAGAAEFGLDATLSARGLRGAGLGAWLPPGITSPLADGSLTAQLRTTHRTADGATDLELRDLRLQDGERTWLALPGARVDLAAFGRERLHVRELALRGLQLPIDEQDDATLLLGLRFAAAPSAPSEPAPNPPAPTQPANSPRAPANPAPLQLPAELAIDAVTLDLQALQRLRNGVALAPPASLQVRLAAPWALRGAPSLAEPLQLQVTAALPPLLPNATLALRLRPFALEPTFTADLQLGPLDTTQLASQFPASQELLLGRTDRLSITGQLSGQLDLRRKDPLQFDFARPFGASLLLADLRVAAGDAPPAVQVADAEIQVRSFDPRTGHLVVHRIDVLEPVLRAERSADGIEFAGLCLRTPPAAASGTPAAPNRSPAPPPPADAALVRLDLLRVLGLEVDWRDATTTPATHLPIADLDLEVRGASSRMFTDAVPLELRIDGNGGAVELDRRVASSSVLAGVLGSTAKVVALQRNQHQRESRPLFEQLTIQANLVLAPVVDGTFRVRLDSFELPALRGLVAPSGVQIADGVLDARIDGELRGTAGGVVRSLPVFSHLSITEPPGGPISTYLRLPAPLDTVLFLLRNEDGQQRLPIRIALDDHRLDPTTIRDAAVETIALLLSDAVGSTPWRILRTATDLFGITGPLDLDGLATGTTFAAGAVTPGPLELRRIAAVLREHPDRRVVLRHAASAADLPVAAARANPSEPVLRQAIDRLRTERRELLAARTPLALDVAARLAGGRGTETWPLQDRLAALDQRLGELEQTLDAALTQLTADSPRAAARRTGEALRDLGAERLAAVQRLLLAELGPGAADRIELRSPRPTPEADRDGPGKVTLVVR